MDEAKEETPPPPPRGVQPSLEQIARSVERLSQQVAELSQQNQNIEATVDTLRTESPANVHDETRLTRVITTAVSAVLSAKADQQFKVKLPTTLATLMEMYKYNENPHDVLHIKRFDDTFKYLGRSS